MARGWESKSVEEQQAERFNRPKSSEPPLSRARQRSQQKREGLLLSRTHLLRQIEGARHAQRRAMLQQALAEIERQLIALEQDSETDST